MNFLIVSPFKAAEMVASFNPSNTLGVEVTIENLAAVCGLGNIDHHRAGDDENTPSACEQALNWDLTQLSNDTDVVGIMADADTVTAMAVLKYRQQGLFVNSDLVNKIGKIDRLGASKCFDEMQDDAVQRIRAICGRFELDIDVKVDMVAQLLTGYSVPETDQYLIDAEKAFNDAVKASTVTLVNGVVIVESSHRMATQIGYQHGDVVVCLNNNMPVDFKNPEGDTYRKFTVCKRDSHVKPVIDFDALNTLEGANGKWGGRPTIGGSPQGEDSTLTIEQVLSCIK